MKDFLNDFLAKSEIRRAFTTALRLKGSPLERKVKKQLPLYIRLIYKDSPIIGANVHFLDRYGKDVPELNSLEETMSNGLCSVLYNKSERALPPKLQIKVILKDKTEIFFPNIILPTSGVHTYQAEKDYRLEVFKPGFPFKLGKKPYEPKQKEFTVVLGGTSTQLRQILKLLQDQPCIHVKAIYVKNGIKKEEPYLREGLEVYPFDEFTEKNLEGVDAFLDFTDSQITKELMKKAKSREIPQRPIILPGCNRILIQIDDILARFMTNNEVTKEGGNKNAME